jgi:hypothetical protein
MKFGLGTQTSSGLLFIKMGLTRLPLPDWLERKTCPWRRAFTSGKPAHAIVVKLAPLFAQRTYAKNSRSPFRSSLCSRDHARCHRQLTAEQPSVFPVD